MMTILELLSGEVPLILIFGRNPKPSSSNNFEEAYEELDEINIADPTVDRYYRFEGYQIYQLKDVETSVADISDPEKARLVAQCDIENDIDRVINFDFDEALGFSIPVEMVDGSNNGIRHSFKLTEDKFAQGSPTLVNHKTYYYVAVAYAYNQFKEYNLKLKRFKYMMETDRETETHTSVTKSLNHYRMAISISLHQNISQF